MGISWFRKKPKLLDEMRTEPGITDPNMIVMVSYLDGEAVCQYCAKPFDGQAKDVPANNVGAYVRLHPKCGKKWRGR